MTKEPKQRKGASARSRSRPTAAAERPRRPEPTTRSARRVRWAPALPTSGRPCAEDLMI